MRITNILTALTAAAALVGCSSDDMFSSYNTEQGNRVIDFGTYITRATVLDTTSLQAGGFTVYAYLTNDTTWTDYYTEHTTKANANDPVPTVAPNFMNYEHATFSNNAWSYEVLKYWPLNDNYRISFFACAPTDRTNLTNAVQESQSGTPSVKYTIAGTTDSAKVANMYDLTRAEAKDKQYSVSPVRLKFEHALSRVNFRVRSADTLYVAGSTSKSTRIYLKDIKLEGTRLYSGGTLNLLTNVWDSKSDPTSFSVNSIMNLTDNAATDAYTVKKSFVLGADTVPHEIFTESAASNLGKNKHNYLYMVPTGTMDATDNIKVTFYYTVVTLDSKVGSYTSYDVISNPISIKQELVQGKAYNWKFTLGLNKIEFESEIGTDWDYDTNVAGNGNSNGSTAGNGNNSNGEVDEIINETFRLYGSGYGWTGNSEYNFTPKSDGTFEISISDALENGFMISTVPYSQNNQFGGRSYDWETELEVGTTYTLWQGNAGCIGIQLKDYADKKKSDYTNVKLTFDPVNKTLVLSKNE
jgi:hypothetical protein